MYKGLQVKMLKTGKTALPSWLASLTFSRNESLSNDFACFHISLTTLSSFCKIKVVVKFQSPSYWSLNRCTSLFTVQTNKTAIELRVMGGGGGIIFLTTCQLGN